MIAAQNGVTRLPIWSPTESASSPRCTLTPTASAAVAVTNPWMTHWPPLEGTKMDTTAEASAVKNGKV